MKISVVIPVYNEAGTIERVIRRVKDVNMEKEIIVIDDCSTDGSGEILRRMNGNGIRAFFHEKNQGKGAALRTGFKHVSGEVVVIQDADLEYDPQDYAKLIKPIKQGITDVVYGSRFLTDEAQHKRPFYVVYYLGNIFLSFLLRLFFRTKITDMQTCFKMIRRKVLEKNIDLTARGFDADPEITVQLLRRGVRIYEVPISYSPRGYKQGKKISWKDGVLAIWILLKYRFKRMAKK